VYLRFAPATREREISSTPLQIKKGHLFGWPFIYLVEAAGIEPAAVTVTLL